jgi:signal transduction histidine kinase/ligand-binding sensor domain-containing protein
LQERFEGRRTFPTLLTARLFPFVLLLCFPCLTHAERLPLKAYTVADGLAHNEINKIVRDSRGFLWFCTADGLSRFDGYTFTNFGTDQGLPHANVTDLLETRRGEYWVATYGGIVRFNPKGGPANRVVYAGDASAIEPMFTVIVPEDQDRRARAVTVLLEDRNGTLWCGTQKGLSKLERTNDRVVLRSVDIGIPGEYPEQGIISDLLEDQHGSLWIAAPSGLYRRWPDGSAARYTKHDGLPAEYLSDLLEDHEGHLWAGSPLGGFFGFAADSSHAPPVVAVTYTVREGLPANWVFQLFETANHRFWVATGKGLAEFFPNGDEHGQRFRSYTERNGLSFHDITALNEDLGGNLWLGTKSAGAMKLANNGFVTYDEQDALYEVNAIFADRSGSVCFKGNVLGNERTTVFEGAKLDVLDPRPPNFHQRFGCFDGQRFNWFHPKAPFYFGWVMEEVTLQARNGEWWAGSGEGLYRFPPSDHFGQINTASPLAVYTTKDGLAALQVFRLFEDSRGNVWISTSSSSTNGLARWERATGSVHDLANSPGLPSLKDNLPRSFGEDRVGNVWIGFNSGLARFAQGNFKFFTAAEGLPQGSIMNIYLDHAGRPWLASARGGLVRIDDPGAERPSFISYTTAQGLSSNDAEVIAEDIYGHLYVGGGNGLDRLDPATGRVKHFTTADGLAPGSFRAAFRDRKGVLWFGMTRGLSRFAPAPDDPAAPPPVLISGLRVAGSPRLVSALGEKEMALPDLAANDNQLQIDFVALGFAPGEVLRYQYKLEGADSNWSAPSEQRRVNYANLAPGRYRFLVRAENSDDTFSVIPASVTFRILRPVWQRWWFLALAVIAVGVMVYAFYRYRMARLLEMANVRTRMATDLHDDIGSGLSRMAILSEVVKQQMGNNAEQSVPLLTEIADSARTLVDSMRDIVWSIDPRRDDLSNVVSRIRQFASDVLEPQKIKLDFQAPSEMEKIKLDPEQRRHLYLIFKEAINNIARHAECASVSLSINVSHNRLIGEIRDDGRGFSDLHPQQSPTNGGAGGHGLGNMQSRAAQLGGNLNVDSSPSRGTCLKLTIPLKKP